MAMHESAFAKWLKDQLNETGMSQSELARLVGFPSQSAISNIIHGKRRVKLDERVKIEMVIAGVNSPDHDSSINHGNQLNEAEVPVIGFVGAGGEIVFEDNYALGDGMYHVERLPGLNNNRIIGLEVRGNSMYPFFRDGHIVFIVRESWDHVEDAALTDWAVCRLSDGRTLLKEIRPSHLPGRYDLLSQNAPPMEGVELVWATPVMGHRRRA